MTESDVTGKLVLCPRDIFVHVDTRRDVLPFFFFSPPLPVSYHEAQQSSLNLTPYIGRNVLCGRLPAFIHTLLSANGLRRWLLRDFIKIGERQWSCLNMIYCISVPTHGVHLLLWLLAVEEKSWNWTWMGHWGLIWQCSTGQRGQHRSEDLLSC